jgi:hypothetical protein
MVTFVVVVTPRKVLLDGALQLVAFSVSSSAYMYGTVAMQ